MKTRATIAICLAAGALAGCSSTDDYVDKVNDIQTQAVEASNAIGADLNATQKDVLIAIDSAKVEAGDAVSELSELDVPSDAEEGHAQLVAAFDDLEKLFADVREQIESSSGQEAFAELRTEGAEIDKEIDAALDQINEDLGLK